MNQAATRRRIQATDLQKPDQAFRLASFGSSVGVGEPRPAGARRGSTAGAGPVSPLFNFFLQFRSSILVFSVQSAQF